MEAKSAFLEDSGTGGLVHVGTPQEMFAKLKRTQEDVEALQAQSDTLRSDKNSLNRDILSLQRLLAEQEETILNLRRENERYVSKVNFFNMNVASGNDQYIYDDLIEQEESRYDGDSKVAELRSQNTQLQTSLADIANVVLDNLEESDGSGPQDDIVDSSANTLLLTSTPIKPKIMR